MGRRFSVVVVQNPHQLACYETAISVCYIYYNAALLSLRLTHQCLMPRTVIYQTLSRTRARCFIGLTANGRVMRTPSDRRYDCPPCPLLPPFASRLLCKLRACAAERMGASGEGGKGGKAAAASCNGCFASPDCATPVARRALLDAARIAGFGEPKVCTVALDSSQIYPLRPSCRCMKFSLQAQQRMFRQFHDAPLRPIPANLHHPSKSESPTVPEGIYCRCIKFSLQVVDV